MKLAKDSFNKILSKQLTHDRSCISDELKANEINSDTKPANLSKSKTKTIFFVPSCTYNPCKTSKGTLRIIDICCFIMNKNGNVLSIFTLYECSCNKDMMNHV